MITYDPMAAFEGDAPCVLCGAEDVVCVNVFTLPGPRSMPERSLMYPYQLCAECSTIPGATAVVEAVLANLMRKRVAGLVALHDTPSLNL